MKPQINAMHTAIRRANAVSLSHALMIMDNILDDINKPHDELWDDEELEEFENELEELEDHPLDALEYKAARHSKRNIHKTKTIHRINNKFIEQSIWTKFLISIDSVILPYHNCNDLIIISSAYSMHAIMRSLDIALDKLHLFQC